MKQHHQNCKDPDCRECFDDVMNLKDVLDHLTGHPPKEDHLGRYRGWLETKGFVAETEYGWPTPIVFNDKMIKEYVNEYNTTFEDASNFSLEERDRMPDYNSDSPFLQGVDHSYLQTDGTYMWPNSREGDLLREAKKEIDELRKELRRHK